MSKNKIIFDPSNKVIFKGFLDDLVEEVQGNEFMYVSLRKIISERLTFSKILGQRTK
jgi:hypothetical protein